MSIFCEKQTIEIFKGESPEIQISLFQDDLKVLKLNAVNDIVANFLDQDGVKIIKNLAAGVTIVDPDAGEITVQLSEANTLSMSEGENQDFEVEVEFGTGEKRVAYFSRVLTVKGRL